MPPAQPRVQRKDLRKKTDRGIIGEGNATQPSPQPCRASSGMSYLEEGSQPAHLHPHAVQGTLGELQSTNTGTVKLGAKADTRQESCSRANWGFGLGCFRTDPLYTALGSTRAGKQAEAFSQFLFYSVGHRTPVLPLEAQGSTTLPLRHYVLHTLLAAVLFLPRGLQGKWPHVFFSFPWPGSPHHLCATTGSGSWGKVTAMGRMGRSSTSTHKMISARTRKGKGRKHATRKESGYFSPLHLDVVGQLHRAVFSLVSQVDAVEMLDGERSAEISTPQMFPHMQANKTNMEIKNKKPQTLRVSPNF